MTLIARVLVARAPVAEHASVVVALVVVVSVTLTLVYLAYRWMVILMVDYDRTLTFRK